jgi:hypothetical protein
MVSTPPGALPPPRPPPNVAIVVLGLMRLNFL